MKEKYTIILLILKKNNSIHGLNWLNSSNTLRECLILVPTADTVKYKYVLEKLLIGKKNCLISGETGVGKSVIVGEFVSTLTT